MIQVALFVTALLSLLIGTFVFLNNPRALLFRVYFIFSITSALWMIVNGLVVGDPVGLSPGALLTVGRLITPLALLTLTFLYLFLRMFRRTSIGKYGWVAAAPTIIICIFSFSNYNVFLDANNELVLGRLFPIYLATVMLNVCLVLHALYGKSEHHPRSNGHESLSSQLKYLRVGTFSAVIPTVAIGALLPLVSSTSFSNIGPLFSIAFLICSGIAIVRHRLFDIRTLVARSVAYVSSLVALSALFVSVTFIITDVLFSHADLHGGGLTAVYTILAVGLAFAFPVLKVFFDKTTDRIFFRDSYDTQVFLDQFNKMLVSTFDLRSILERSSHVIADNLKPTSVIFDLKATETTRRRVAGTTGHIKLSDKDIAYVDTLVPHIRQKVIEVNALEGKHVQLRNVLERNNIAIVARLSVTSTESGIGYLFLGPRKSGNLYSSQDIKVVEIITNGLVLAIQNSLRTEEIEHFNLTLQEKVNDATRKLRRTNEKLKEMDETKDDFISMASHQLRTPLTSVKGYLSMVLEEDAGKVTPMQREMLGQAFFSSQRMVYLIADLLNVSRLKTGKFIIDPVPVNLDEIVHQELNQLEETAAARELTLQYDKPVNFPTLMLDETKTRQVIMNFVDNAIYYTPAGGHIVVKLLETPTTVELRVEDNGIGVPKHEQPHLFTKFYRAGNARQARPDGTGLGLFMAKKVIIAQSGSLIFESQEGKGSTFGFTFYKSKVGLPAEAPKREIKKPAAVK
ncbi:MAG: Sensor protein resE [Candidatus Saccharibacteria bacterium]|nr:Sensor protein resE [Candidatus Saccharibacteria bacterium]